MALYSIGKNNYLKQIDDKLVDILSNLVIDNFNGYNIKNKVIITNSLEILINKFNCP